MHRRLLRFLRNAPLLRSEHVRHSGISVDLYKRGFRSNLSSTFSDSMLHDTSESNEDSVGNLLGIDVRSSSSHMCDRSSSSSSSSSGDHEKFTEKEVALLGLKFSHRYRIVISRMLQRLGKDVERIAVAKSRYIDANLWASFTNDIRRSLIKQPLSVFEVGELKNLSEKVSIFFVAV